MEESVIQLVSCSHRLLVSQSASLNPGVGSVQRRRFLWPEGDRLGDSGGFGEWSRSVCQRAASGIWPPGVGFVMGKPLASLPCQRCVRCYLLWYSHAAAVDVQGPVCIFGGFLLLRKPTGNGAWHYRGVV